MSKEISWSKASLEDCKIASKIAKRALMELTSLKITTSKDFLQSTQMDIVATHISGCCIRLEELLTAKRGDFLHDVTGIARHLNRQTGELENCFLPRLSR